MASAGMELTTTTLMQQDVVDYMTCCTFLWAKQCLASIITASLWWQIHARHVPQNVSHIYIIFWVHKNYNTTTFTHFSSPFQYVLRPIIPFPLELWRLETSSSDTCWGRLGWRRDICTHTLGHRASKRHLETQRWTSGTCCCGTATPGDTITQFCTTALSSKTPLLAVQDTHSALQSS